MKDNPYQAPDSDLTADIVQMPKTIWWKVFLIINLILLAFLVVALVFLDEMTASLFDAFDLFITLIAVVGLFGIAFNKRIGKVSFWKYFFYFFLVISIVTSFIFPLFGVKQFGQVAQFDLVSIFDIGYISIFIWASYLYGFKRPQIWTRISNSRGT